jgi:hypothetical protein
MIFISAKHEPRDKRCPFWLIVMSLGDLVDKVHLHEVSLQ